MIIAASVHVVELVGLMVTALRIRALKQEALNFIGGVKRVAFFFVQIGGKLFEQPTDIRSVWLTAFVDYVAKDQNFAGAEDICGSPVKGAPIHAQAQIAFTLRGKATDGRAIKSKIVPALDEELFVIVKHVQTAFQVAEQDGDGLDALFVSQVLDPLFLNLVRSHAVLAL